MEGFRVLLVEDIAAVREPVGEALADAGIAVVTADGSRAAMHLMGRHSFDMLVTDIHLDTQFAGLDLARHWQARFPGRPLVFATAYPRAAVDFAPLGERDGYLQKPYLPSELITVIRFIMDRRPAHPPNG